MNPYLAKMSRDTDFVWDTIIDNLPTDARRSRTNFINFNCPMCVSMGESADRKKRCGISKAHDSITVKCFNCDFKSFYKLGSYFNKRFRDFLSGLGVDGREIDRLAHRASQIARLVNDSQGNVVVADVIPQFIPRFSEVTLPQDSAPIRWWSENGLDDPDFLEVKAYIDTRGSIVAASSYWSPDDKWKHRAIFPCHYRDKIVGWTGRLVHQATDDNPRYLNEVPPNYLSNCDVMNDYTRRYIMMPEGFLDALAIDGISPFGAKLSAAQTNWIKETGKEVIVIPDRDKSGQRLVDHAIANGWGVAFPRLRLGGNNWWEEDVKDCAEAVRRYGRLYTLRSIIETAKTSRFEIEVKRKWLY